MVLMLQFASKCTIVRFLYQYIFQKRKEKTGKKEKRKPFFTGGARRFVKVFDILFDSIIYIYAYQKKWQNP